MKTRIKQDFNKAATLYDEHAVLQRRVARHLFDFAKEKIINMRQMLDLGCGTGYFHELVRQNKINYHIVQLDLAVNMCKIAQSYATLDSQTICADMEYLPIKDEQFDGIFSSLAFQWAEDIQHLLKEAARVLKKDSYLAISTLGPASLKELSFCFAQIDQDRHINQFHSRKTLLEAINHAGFSEVIMKIDDIVMHHASTFEIMQSIKKIGARHKAEQKGRLSKSKFLALEQIYQKHFKQQQGLPVTWQIYLFLCKKT